MKKVLLFLLTFVCSFALLSCGENTDNSTSDNEDVQTPDTPSAGQTPEALKLSTPIVKIDEDGLVSWGAVENASGYVFKIGDLDEVLTDKLSVQLINGESVVVKAKGDGIHYTDSDFSTAVTYVAPTIIPSEEIEEYIFEGTETVGPYTVYNEDGTIFEPGAGEEANPNNSMFNAIRLAGANSKNSNKMYVEDANGLQIFKRQSKSSYWCYDGTNFVGSKSRSEAISWCEGRMRSYLIDGQGLAFQKLGINYYNGSDLSQNIPLELFSGGYNYMFSEHGIIESDVWTKLGFGYMEMYCRLSEAKYMPNLDTQNRSDDAWNAYIFINGAAGLSCDLGLIGNLNTSTNTVNWRLVRNCQHGDHANNEQKYGPSFTVLQGGTNVTQMTWNEEEGCYTGADDLFFQCWQGVDGWILKITNLRTNNVHTIDERHTGMFAGNEQYFRFLLAASYCPVVQNVWNARCGAYLRNVVFDNVKIARYNAEIGYENYDSSSLLDFYPGVNMIYGFSQASDCASSIYGIREANGTYKSGATYNEGDYYISYSCYYDGGGHN